MYSVKAEISAYFNDPANGGYQTAGTPFEELGKGNREGFLASFQRDYGYAVLYRRVPVGGRMTQFNMAVRWTGILPLCFLEELKTFLSRQTPEDCGDIRLAFGDEEQGTFPGEFPVAEVSLVSDILKAYKDDSCLVIDEAYVHNAEKMLADALARIVVPEAGITVGLPLPANTPLCTVNVFPAEEAFHAGEMSKTVINYGYPLERDKEEKTSMEGSTSTLAGTIATAENAVVNLAVRMNEMRVYQLYDSLQRSKSLTCKEGDLALLQELLPMIQKTAKDQLLTRYLFRPRPTKKRETERSGLRSRKKKAIFILLLVICFVLLAMIYLWGKVLMNREGLVSSISIRQAATMYTSASIAISSAIIWIALHICCP